MQICVHADERPPALRQFLATLEHSLDGEARIWAFMPVGQEDVYQQIDVFVDVFDAPDEEVALERIQPAIRAADPGLSIVRGGTTTMRHLAATAGPAQARASNRSARDVTSSSGRWDALITT